MIQLTVIADPDQAAFWLRRLDGLALMNFVSLDAAAAKGVDAGTDVLVDVDLSILAHVQKLIAAFRDPPENGACRIFALDPHALRNHLQADVLGATAKVCREARPTELMAALAGIALPFPSRHVDVPDGLRHGLDAGEALFAHVLGGGLIDRRFVESSAGEMALAVEDFGIVPWIEAVRRHHEGTAQHCLLVSGLASAFAAHLGFRRSDRILVATAAALHDVGKARVPVSILDKREALTDAERAVLRRHPVDGHAMLVDAGGFDASVLETVLRHHERLDGTGYPGGLSGSAIGDLTRVVTVADVFGALIEARCYRLPTPPADAFATLQDDRGGLDQALVQAFRPVALATPGLSGDDAAVSGPAASAA